MSKSESLFSPNVFIILVNWNNYVDTIDCLSSLTLIDYEDYCVIVIDNSSTNGSVREIKRWLGQNAIPYRSAPVELSNEPTMGRKSVLIVESKENTGFAGGNNIGIEIAKEQGADYILLLNNDTIVTKTFLTEMLRTFAIEKDIGIVSGKIYFHDNPSRIWYCGGRIDFVRGAAYHDDVERDGTFETGFITGCLMLIKKDVIEKVGLLDKSYFLNVEDWDYSYKTRKAGFRLYVNANAIIYHKTSSAIGGLYSLRNQYYFHRNRLFFFKRHLRKSQWLLFMAFQMTVAVPAWLLIQACLGNTDCIKGCILGMKDYFAGQFGLSTRI